MRMKLKLLIVCLVGLCANSASAWDSDELEIFDLVEEINQNFYKLLGIEQNATEREIKKAFRGLSIILHPDKNSAEDANIQFRNLVSVYEVLKDTNKREKYNDVLKNGMPNWKSALYYYRRVRKMGLAELGAILFVIITIAQYIIAWAAYVEKKYTAEQMFGSKLKKLQKKNKTNVDIETLLKEIPPPSVRNTLPFQIPLFFWHIPRNVISIYQLYQDHRQIALEEKQRLIEEEEEQREFEEELAKEKENKIIRKRKTPKIIAPEKTDEELVGFASLNPVPRRNESIKAARPAKTTVTGGLWTDDDLVDLVRLVKKYPGGTTDRWELIAETMSRSVGEVTFMAAKMKETGYKIPGQTDSVAENIVKESSKKVKTKQADVQMNETTWSQQQQQALEAAIVKHPKAGSSDRWEKISNSVPGKSREECMLRYKYLVELVKIQKAKKSEEPVPTVETVKSVVDAPAEIGSVQTPDENYVSEEQEEKQQQQSQPKGGKPRNKRKERRKRMEFSSDEDEDDNDNDE